MDKSGGKKGIHKTTIVLVVILILVSSIGLINFVIYPAARHYYVTHRNYELYGGMTEELKKSGLFEDMQSGRSFCFLGDSITIGTVTEGIPWYQPLIPYIKGSISNVSYGGWMTQTLINKQDEIPISQVYVVAIGINDVLFPNEETAPATSEEYINRISRLSDILKNKNPDAKIYFITAWPFIDMGDYYSQRGEDFRASLVEWCKTNDCRSIDPNPYILNAFNEHGASRFMINSFHPNAPEGVGLFSYAVLKADLEQNKGK